MAGDASGIEQGSDPVLESNRKLWRLTPTQYCSEACLRSGLHLLSAQEPNPVRSPPVVDLILDAILDRRLYHTAVEVEGMTEGLEWSFGYAKDESGVFSWVHQLESNLRLGPSLEAYTTQSCAGLVGVVRTRCTAS